MMAFPAVRYILVLCLLPITVCSGQVGLTVGTEYGFGAMARLGSSAVKVELGGGIAPVLFFATVTFRDDIFKIYTPGAIGGKVNFRVNDPDEDARLALEIGGTYNGLLGIGVGGGIDYEVGSKPRIVLGGGLMVYPDAENRLLDRLNEDEGTHYRKSEFSAPLAILQPYVSFTILLGD